MNKLFDSASAAIVPYEDVEKDKVIRPIYSLDDLDESDFLDEVKLGWVRGLKKVAEIEGTTIYWNQEVATKVMNAALSTRRLKPCRKTVYNMFKKAVIIPGFTSRTMFGLIFKKISQTLFGLPHILGFFYSKKKKIFLILENVSSFFFETDDALIAQLLVHELLHYTANDQYSKFFSIFRKMLVDWYSYYFSNLFECDKTDPKFKKLISDILKLLSRTDYGDGVDKIWKPYMEETKKFSNLTRLDEREFKFRYNLHFKFLYAYFTGNMMDVMNIYNHKLIPKCMFNAYKFGIGLGRYPRTFVIQELIFPSEIICCASEVKLIPQMYQIINMIRV